VLATATPDKTFPATATAVQAELGCNGGIAFDLAAVCSGFLYALATADSLLRTGMAKCALVIGAETFSRILDWEDRATCVLFGDGAGAMVLRAENVAADDPFAGPGVLVSKLHADGAHRELLHTDGGPSSTGTVGKVRMAGGEVFRHAVVNLAEVLQEVLDASGYTPADLDWVVPHQAEHAHPRRDRAQARAADLESRGHRRQARQHFGRLGAARVRRGAPRRAHQGRRSRRARGDGGRVHLGGQPAPGLIPAKLGKFPSASLPLARYSVIYVRKVAALLLEGERTLMMRSVGTLTRADLAETINRKLGFSRAESLDLVEDILAKMCGAMSEGENVKISGFGSFILRDKRERIGRNPKTGIEVPITPRRVMTFRASQKLKDRIAEG
jgi:integration host factor alpha subunit